MNIIYRIEYRTEYRTEYITEYIYYWKKMATSTDIKFLEDTMRDYNNVCEQLKEFETQIQPLKMLKSSLDEAINIFAVEKGIQNIVLPPNAGSSISNKQLVQKKTEKIIGFNRQLVYSCIEDVLQEQPDLIAKLLNEIESRLTSKEIITMRLEKIKKTNLRTQKSEKNKKEFEELNNLLSMEDNYDNDDN